MSVSAAEAGPSAFDAPLETVPALDTTNGTSSESAAATAAPRRGTRARKPTSKAAGVDAAEAAAVQETQQTSTRSAKKRKADELAADTAADPDAINNEVAQVFEGASGHASDADDDEDDKQYCICRGKDDGTFMISCERCQEWFHTKCIGITQKAAKKLDEYVCESCSRADTKKTSAKPSKRYKSSAKKKATSPQEPQDDEMESDDAQNEDEASDGDEYIGEQGENASDVEGAPKEEASSSTKPARTRRLQKQDTHASRAESPSSDTEMRSKPSQGARRPSGPAKSATGAGPKKGGPRKPTGPTDASTEDARSRARKVLATALEKIFATHGSESASEEEEETDAQRGEAYAALLEAELFDATADAHGSIRVVASRYKDRFRTFLFSLKDAKNTTLHSRIASGELAAAELAKMSNEELANDTIRQATEKARLDALHRSTLRAEEAGPMRKITHKGEVEIESDALLARDQPDKFQIAVDRKTDVHQRISESEPAIPTQGPTSPGSDSVKESEEGPEETGATTSERTATRNSAPAPDAAQGSPSRLNFGDVWARNADSKTQDDDQNDHETTESYGFDVGSPHDEAYGHEAGVETEGAATSGADDFIDSFLDGKDDHDADETTTSKDATQAAARSTTPDCEPSSLARHRFRTVIWNGLMDLPDIFAFKGHVKQVAGRSIAHAPRLRTKFLPDRPLLIAGRLPTKAAVDYLLQVANAARTEILAFALEPGAIKDGATQATESDRTSFDGILKHFKDADRWGALHVSSSVKGSLIKDFYVAPLRQEDEVPLWLDMTESDCLGTDWHAKRDRDMLILVAVVIRDSLQAELVKAERGGGGHHRSTTKDGAKPQQEKADAEAGEAYDPTAGISIPLGPSSGTGASAIAPAAPGASAGFGSDALQSLLRTLGKTAPAPANPASMSSPAAGASMMANVGGATPPGPPPPGPPPGPPPMLVPPGGGVAPNRSPLAGSWPPHPPADEAGAGAHWQPPQGYAPQGYEAHMPAPPGPAAGWDQGSGWNYPPGPGMHPPPGGEAPQPAPELPEEEYPGQYNPDYLAQASAGAGRGGAGYGPRGGGHAYGHGYGQAYGHGRGRGGWRGRGW